MPSRRARFLVFFTFAIALSTPVLAQWVDVPLRNWTIPPYRSSSASGGLSTMTDISPGIGFVAVTPCRIADTRGLGFTGQAGPPVLDTGTRTFQITGTVAGVPAQCGIPTGADAVSFQFTIVAPNSNGNLIAWPAGGAPPTISILNWSAGETALGNGTIVPVSAAGALSVRINAAVGSATGHLVLDVNGYFTDDYPSGVSFEASSATVAPAIAATNTSTVANAIAIRGEITAAGAGLDSAAVRGVHSGTGFDGFGVYGSHAAGGTAVKGVAAEGTGVWGDVPTATGSGTGVVGTHGGVGIGVSGYAEAGTGVFGEVGSEIGSTTGVEGIIYSTGINAAGVRGRATDRINGEFLNAAVRGDNDNNTGFGVLGLSNSGFSGVSGYRVVMGAAVTGADLGFSATVGLNVTGATQATGTKSFVEPHPTDPSQIIRYVSLEGNEAGTYFRGRGKFQNGLAVIDVPEDFRIVTSPEGLSVQVTPIGQRASVAVESIGLDRIVVRGSRNVEFFYTVNGVRLAYADFEPLAPDDKTIVPRSAKDSIPASYPSVIRERLIANGTYLPDGKVNMETARRLGWDKAWEEPARPAKPRE